MDQSRRNPAFEERLNWRRWVTAKGLETKPIHRWFAFPHSFSSELIHALIGEWGLAAHDRILDPFAGAGTTVLAAKEKGVPATGYDLLPLAVMVGQAKVANYNVSRLEETWHEARGRLARAPPGRPCRTYPELVHRALPGRLLGAFEGVLDAIRATAASEAERRFLQLAVLSLLPCYSRAEANGGWLRWVTRSTDHRSLFGQLDRRVESMIADLRSVRLPRRRLWRVQQADARALPDVEAAYSAVVTSPPYPNRHDYTRIFAVELMLAFLDPEEARRLRYQSFHSHPEARPDRPSPHYS